jgi:hypothetical protein
VESDHDRSGIPPERTVPSAEIDFQLIEAGGTEA